MSSVLIVILKITWSLELQRIILSNRRSAAVVPQLIAPLRHGTSLQLGREEKEQRKPPQISRQVLISTGQRPDPLLLTIFSLVNKKNKPCPPCHVYVHPRVLRIRRHVWNIVRSCGVLDLAHRGYLEDVWRCHTEVQVNQAHFISLFYFECALYPVEFDLHHYCFLLICYFLKYFFK